MGAIQDIFKDFGPEYIERFGHAMPQIHLNTIEAILDCRTEACGVTVYDCQECGAVHRFYRSCGNRHCPSCQHQKALHWMTRHLENALPGHHFMVTFTVPEEIRSFIRSNQKACYSAMFKASSDFVKRVRFSPYGFGLWILG